MSGLEFWNLHRVLEVTGLSRSLIYREMRKGRFPANRPYRNQPRRRFWLSIEVEAWQRGQLVPDEGCRSIDTDEVNEFDALLRAR